MPEKTGVRPVGRNNLARENRAMPEFLTLKEAVAAHLEDGMMAAFEGFTHLMPYAAAHEVIRQEKRDLTVVRMTRMSSMTS